MMDNAKKELDFVVNIDDFPNYAKDKKKAKKLADTYTYFIAQASLMPKVAQTFGRIFGPKNKMPNPKSGTVTPEPINAIEEIRKGKIEMRVDKDGILHNIFGKVSFEDEKLKENLATYIKKVVEVKPSTTKGVYLHSMFLTTSMGPSIQLDVHAVCAEVK